MKRLLLLTVLLAVALPATASAAGSPCRNKVFNDWYRNGKISSSYPATCYRDALKHIPVDAGIYSNLSDDVRAAMRAAARRANGKSVPREVGHGFRAIGGGNAKGKATPISANTSPHDPVAIGAPVADTTSSGTPLPIIVLGALALLLAAAGAVGVGVRRVRSRR